MNPKRTLLYIGALWPGSTSYARMQAIEQLGWTVLPFDVSGYFRGSSYLSRRLATRYILGAIIRKLNHELIASVHRAGTRIDCIWIDKGVWIEPTTLRCLKALTRSPAVHYTPDPHFGFNAPANRLFKKCIPDYDLMFTTKPFEIDDYVRSGAREVLLVNQSYDQDQLFPRRLSDADRRKFGSQLCFIGQYDRPRARFLSAASKTHAHLRIWGPAWRRWRWRHAWLRRAFSGDGAFGDDYARALVGTDIGLCFLTKLVPETTTTRSFEIPGCGVFMLAERTDEHRALFEEGVEAEFFSESEEMSDKIRFYLAHPGARQKIALAGFVRCQKSGYGNRARMKEILTSIDEKLGSRASSAA